MTEFTEPMISDHLTHHNRTHFKTCARVLDGIAEDADPAEFAHVALGVDMDRDPEQRIKLELD